MVHGEAEWHRDRGVKDEDKNDERESGAAADDDPLLPTSLYPHDALHTVSRKTADGRPET